MISIILLLNQAPIHTHIHNYNYTHTHVHTQTLALDLVVFLLLNVTAESTRAGVQPEVSSC